MKTWFIAAILLGLVLAINGQNTAPIADLEAAVKTSPNSAEAWYNLGVGKFGRNWADDAKLAFIKAIELKPDYAEAHVALGAWYLRPTRACALGVTNFDRLKAERQSRVALAVGFLEKAIEFKPVYPVAFVHLGRAYTSIEKPDKAAEAFEKAIEHGVGNLWVVLYLANLYNTLGRNEDAIKSYRSVIGRAISTSNLEVDKPTTDSLDSIWVGSAYRELAALYARLGRFDEALQTYAEIVRLKADDGDAHYNLGLLFVKLGDSSSAEREYQALKKIAAKTKHDYSRKELRMNAKKLLDQIRKSSN